MRDHRYHRRGAEPRNKARAKIRKLFRRLRDRHGFFARMNYQCCGGCAAYAAGQEAGKDQPVAWMHAQDMERFDGDHLSGLAYIGYGVSRDPYDEEADRRIGEIIASEAKEAGLVVDWDGSPLMRIGVREPTEADAEFDRLIGKGG